MSRDFGFWLIVYLVAKLFPSRKPSGEDALSTPEYMRKYKGYGEKIYDKVAKEMDYGRILEKGTGRKYKAGSNRKSRRRKDEL